MLQIDVDKAELLTWPYSFRAFSQDSDSHPEASNWPIIGHGCVSLLAGMEKECLDL